ncbi:MAG: metal ABC transporter substrate-binding protein [Planctomycetota bacterium]
MTHRSTGWMVLLAVLLSVLVAPACSKKAAKPGGPLRVVVTIAPLAGLVTPMLPQGGGGATLKILMTPGRSEHGYEFTPQDLVTLGEADVIVLVGLGLEPKVEQFLRDHPSASRQVVDCGKSLGLVEPADAEHMREHDEPAKPQPQPKAKPHDHDDDHDHDHHAIDPHVWLDPILVSQLVPAIRSALQTAMVARGHDLSAAFDAAQDTLLADVLAVDDEYRKALTPFKGRAIVTHHSAWERLAERYDLRVVEVLRPVESSEPDPSKVAAIVEAVKKERVPAIFVEPQFDRGSAQRIAQAAGLKVVVVDPLGTGDWFKMMRSNLAAFVEAFEIK